MTNQLHPSVPAGSGQSVRLPGLTTQFKVGGEQTGGAFSIVEHRLEPGTLVPPHTHDAIDEVSCTIEGVVGTRVGAETIEASGPGSYVVKPRGLPHTLWNPGSTPARILEIISPAGFERFFAESAEIYASGAPDPAALLERAMAYGLTFHGDLGWVEELTAAYGLTLEV
jgi:quercetin dioxygenase-like cupin family protein